MAVDLSLYRTNFRKDKKYPGLFTSLTEKDMGLGRAIISIPAAPLYRTYLTYKAIVALFSNLSTTLGYFFSLNFKDGFRDLVLGTSWDVIIVLGQAIQIFGDLMRETFALFTRCFATLPVLAVTAYKAALGSKDQIQIAPLNLDVIEVDPVKLKVPTFKIKPIKLDLSSCCIVENSIQQSNSALNLLFEVLDPTIQLALSPVEHREVRDAASEVLDVEHREVRDVASEVLDVEHREVRDVASEVLDVEHREVRDVTPDALGAASNEALLDVDAEYAFGADVGALFGYRSDY